MNILSINFGHDASLCIFSNGKLIDFVEVERESRLKHHLGLSYKFITEYLTRNKKSFDQFDLISLSGTQLWGSFHDNLIKIKYGYSPLHKKYTKDYGEWKLSNFAFSEENFNPGGNYKKQLETQGLDTITSSPLKALWKTPFLPKIVDDSTIICELLSFHKNATKNFTQELQSDFFVPLTIEFDGITKPGFYTDHHAAHANYAGYYAKENSIIVTHDGGLPTTKLIDESKSVLPFNSGGIYLFDKQNGIVPIVSHNLALGYIYDRVAFRFGIDAGKLMGLASYGKFNKQINQIIDQYILELFNGNCSREFLNKIVQAILKISSLAPKVRKKKAKSFKFDFQNYPFAIQSAANVQQFVQRVYVEIVNNFCETLNEFDHSFKDVFMTGGFSLNCPTNSAIISASPSLNYKPLPGVGDTGLSLGAAVGLHFFLGLDLQLENSNDVMAAAFPPSSFDPFSKKDKINNLTKINCTPKLLHNFIANELAKGKVFCIHRGRSEVGPRALGHRSIIAWAGIEGVRDFINERKGRENWRPLAPICSVRDFSKYFAGEIEDARFMLTVSKSKTMDVPAITHVDNTARVQVIDENDVFLFKILNELKSLDLAPVIVNTSFNCAGEPLVETFDDAVNSFKNMGFDYLVSELSIFEKNANIK